MGGDGGPDYSESNSDIAEDDNNSDPEDSDTNSARFPVDLDGSDNDTPESEEGSDEDFGGAEGGDQTARQLDKQVQLESSLCSLFNDLMTSHDLSINGCQKVLAYVTENAAAIRDHLDEGGKICKNVQTIRIRQTSALPKVRNTLYKKVLQTNQATRRLVITSELVGDFLKVPRAALKLDIVRNVAYVSLLELQNYFKQLPGHSLWQREDLSRVDVAIDGLPKAKSSSSTLIIFTLIWPLCGHPIVYRAIEHRFGWEPDGDQLLAGFKTDLEKAGMSVRYLRADAKERHTLLNMIQPAGRFSCDWCLSRGYTRVFPSVTVHPANDDKVGSITLKPSQTSKRRTHAEVVAMGKRAEEEKLSFPLQSQGIKGPTAAHKLPGLDVVRGNVLENMHASFEGAVKRITKAAWNLDSKTKLPSPDVLVLNKYLQLMKTPTESPRNAREVDVAHWKAYEFWLFILHVVPALVDGESLLVDEKMLAKQFLLLAFLLRAVELPGRAFEDLEQAHSLDQILETWYKIVDEHFDHRHSVYNVHVVGTHLLEARRQLGPLFQVSTWPLEGSFKYVNKSYAGTTNVPKQIVTNMLLRERKHRCLRAKKKLRWNASPSAKNDDSLAQTEDGNFVRLLENNEDGSWRCNILKVTPLSCEHVGLEHLHWKAVGVMTVEENAPERIKMYKTSDFVAKAVICKKTISSMPLQWIYETIQ